jgi:hypothetical protein
MAFSSEYQNMIALAKGSSTNVRSGPGTNQPVRMQITAQNGLPTTGYYLTEGDFRWIQVIIRPEVYGYVRNDVVQLVFKSPSSKPVGTGGRYDKLTVTAKYASTEIRKLPGNSAEVNAKLGTIPYRTTGSAVREGQYTWIQLYNAQMGIAGYVREDLVKFGIWVQKSSTVKPAVASKESAQNMINEMIANDQTLSLNINRNLAECRKLRSEGKDVSKIEDESLVLMKRYLERQVKLKENEDLFQFQQEAPSKLLDGTVAYMNLTFPGSGDLISYLKPSVKGIGVAPAIIAVVAVVIIAATAGICYALFKDDYETGKRDLKVSDDLAEALRLIDQAHPGEKKSEQILADLNKQVDDSYNAGKHDGKTGKTPWYLWAGLGAITLGLLQSRSGRNAIALGQDKFEAWTNERRKQYQKPAPVGFKY